MNFFSSFGGSPFGGFNGGQEDSDGKNFSMQTDKNLTTQLSIKCFAFPKMPAKKKLKSLIENLLKSIIQINPMAMPQSLNKSQKLMRLSQTPKKEEYMINMVPKDPKLAVTVVPFSFRYFKHVFRRSRRKRRTCSKGKM
jgi:hypothetical protein